MNPPDQPNLPMFDDDPPPKPVDISRLPSDVECVYRWRCPNCGQTFFTLDEKPPPDHCDYCNDMTTWQQVRGEDS